MSEMESVLKVLEKIADKLSLIMPMFLNIENRLDRIENELLTNSTISMSSEQSIQFDSEHEQVLGGIDEGHGEPPPQKDQETRYAYHGHGGGSHGHAYHSHSGGGHAHHSHSDGGHGHSGLILSDSDMTSDLGKLSDYLKCDIPVVNYNSDSETVKQHLLESSLDFVLIQDSGEAVSQQDSLTPESLNMIHTLVGNQLELARMVVRLKPDTEVFIGSLPPRIDTPSHTQLAEAYNDILVAQSFLDEKVTIVSQNGMHTKVQKKLGERFCEDGNRLTRYGTHLMLKNISRQISDKIPGMRYVVKSKSYKYRRTKKYKVKKFIEAIFI